MYALRFKFKVDQDGFSHEAFHSILCDLISTHKSGFPILRTQAYYPDSSDLGGRPPNEFMIEVVNEDGLQALQRFLQNRMDVKQSSILPWNPAEAMSPLQAGMWCHTYHAGVLRLAPASNNSTHSYA
jgi:hypothetical protein